MRRSDPARQDASDVPTRDGLGSSYSKIILAAGLLTISFVLLLKFFERLPLENTSLGIDWHGIWVDIRGGVPHYSAGLRNPPWSIIPILPLGFLSFRSSWALVALMSIAALIVSIPRSNPRWLRLCAMVYLATSYPSLRNIIDGNLEFLTIAGVLLVIWAYTTRNPWAMAIGFLLSSAKPQETWLLIVVMGAAIVRSWPRRRMTIVVLTVLAVVLGSFALWGDLWTPMLIGINERGSILDMSLLAAMDRLAIPSWLSWLSWTGIFAVSIVASITVHEEFDRRLAGALICASLLLAPYAAGNSLIMVLAIAIVPLLWIDFRMGLMLSLAANIPYLFLGAPSVRYDYGAYFGTSYLLGSWAVLILSYRRRKATRLADV